MEKKIISIAEFIDSAKKLGINLGRGNPIHRIRYYIKTGLLPHQVRAKESTEEQASSHAKGHLPSYSLYLLQKIEFLKSQKRSFEEIRLAITKDRLMFEAEQINQSVKPKISMEDLFQKVFTFSTLVLLIITIYKTSHKESLSDTVGVIPQDILTRVQNLYMDSSDELLDKNIILISKPSKASLLSAGNKQSIPLQDSHNITIDKSGNIVVTSESLPDAPGKIGTSILKAHTTTVQVVNPTVTKTSKVFLTPRSKTGGQSLIVSEIAEGLYFTVEIEKPLAEGIIFDWLLVN